MVTNLKAHSRRGSRASVVSIAMIAGSLPLNGHLVITKNRQGQAKYKTESSRKLKLCDGLRRLIVIAYPSNSNISRTDRRTDLCGEYNDRPPLSRVDTGERQCHQDKRDEGTHPAPYG
jgi:hypothetical protein